ncbi:type IV pilus biogenesis/stability protein PilW [Psychrobium sp. 1_MG-2023]|uniref:type IV pilus biogenesis/stability protein PilW n=1 Tax=Psychrobium sp. 1_MG-2023 TaxID=3062624 RepID=UPI002735FB6D|nr:type IV pilus biogenesis/stability protein PilW [Psychrobium sp. 1_MG-2023]MDP2559919.1 type IV pilus biogenesis/stability protein PilW [Psychrobium sp. 1_MG-2023]
MMKIKSGNASSKIVGLICTLFLVSGCVTQQYVTTGDNEVTERVINTREAAMARLKLALEYLRNNKTAQAKLNLDRAAAINPNIDGVQSSYAYYFQTVGEVDKADQAYREALDAFPDNSNTRNNYGAFLCDLARYEQAEKQFVIAIESNATAQMANSYENAGLCALRDQNWARAQKHLSAVLKYESLRVRSLLGLAKAEIELGNFNQAQQQLRSYRGIYAQTPQSLWLSVQLEHKKNNSAMAKKLGSILIRNYPESKEAKTYLNKGLL